jgi:hypothetical protein
MAQHELRSLSFASLTSEHWDSFPDLRSITKQIGDAILAHSEVSKDSVGLYAPPNEIRNVHLTDAAADLIRCMWHGHREKGRRGPPAIPLKVFVTRFGQGNGRSWADVEIHPGVDNWDAA